MAQKNGRTYRGGCFARALARCVREAGISQKELARDIGVSCTYVCRLMGGGARVIPPRPELLVRIIRRLRPPRDEEQELVRLAYLERNPETRFFLPRLLPDRLARRILA